MTVALGKSFAAAVKKIGQEVSTGVKAGENAIQDIQKLRQSTVGNLKDPKIQRAFQSTLGRIESEAPLYAKGDLKRFDEYVDTQLDAFSNTFDSSGQILSTNREFSSGHQGIDKFKKYGTGNVNISHLMEFNQGKFSSEELAAHLSKGQIGPDDIRLGNAIQAQEAGMHRGFKHYLETGDTKYLKSNLEDSIEESERTALNAKYNVFDSQIAAFNKMRPKLSETASITAQPKPAATAAQADNASSPLNKEAAVNQTVVQESAASKATIEETPLTTAAPVASVSEPIAQAPAAVVAQADSTVVSREAVEAPSTSQPIIANQESAPVTTVESAPVNTTDMGSFSADDYDDAILNLSEAPAASVTQSNEVLISSPVAETAPAPAVETQPVATPQVDIPAPVISQETVSTSAAPASVEATPTATASAVEAPDVAQQSLTPQETQYAQSLESVGAGAYEKKIGEAFGVPQQHLDIFAREVNPTNFDKSGKNISGQTLNEVISDYAKNGAQVDPINRLLSNPVLDDASLNAYKTRYNQNIADGLNPIAAAAHNQPAMVNKPHSSFAAALESDKGSIAKILGSGAVGAGLGYGLYDNPEEGFIMGVTGGAMGVGVKKAVGAYSDNIQAGMMKGLLKDNYKPGNTPEALNDNFTAVANLNKEDLGFVDNYYKDTLTKNFGTASMGLQTRTMTLSGAALAGVAFTGNKKDKRRGFNANRGNRI